MEKKFLKIWYSIALLFIIIAIIYYFIRLIDLLFVSEATSQILIDLNMYAIISFGISLLMFILAIPLANIMDKRENFKDKKDEKDKELLAKYKSKKTK